MIYFNIHLQQFKKNEQNKIYLFLILNKNQKI
jgi:hypothetical protein